VRALLPTVTRYDCCINGCFLYFGESAARTRCPTCHEYRLQAGKPRKTFFYYPLIPQIQAMFANPGLAPHLRHHRQFKPDMHRMRDIYDGTIWKELFLPKLGRLDARHLALSLSIDGVEVCKKPRYEVWPILLSILNLPAGLRFLQTSYIICGIIPGPKCADVSVFFGNFSASDHVHLLTRRC